ncbi:Peptidase family S41 [Thiothrix caldifontis]|uniref:Peptidase family S41 n=1 Tax=Thiothrix caldifontis TaxID=525918 RepID=A0A1H3W4D3_9GAMM|nr:S41 family peptidase [Thiothrix caldifontis]SDZ81916.1 Peptidase family S41 [Thiothrix caldifontis]
MNQANVKRTKIIISTKRDVRLHRKNKARVGLEFLANTHPAIREHLASATDLPTFIKSADSLNLTERKQIVEQALILFNDNYVHLPFKRAMHGVNPVQKLHLLKHRLDQTIETELDHSWSFHDEMLKIFNSVRDIHTNYLLPSPFTDKFAFLPFQIEEYFENNKPHYIVTHIIQGFSHPYFKIGVEIQTWNGVPIMRAIALSADMHTGSNLAARHVHGIDGLTIRPLIVAPMPDALWVIVEYTDLDGIQRELKHNWIVATFMPDLAGIDAGSLSTSAVSIGEDLQAELTHQAKKMLFAPTAVATEKGEVLPHDTSASQTIPTLMKGILHAKSVDTSSGLFGYIRIFSFNVENPHAFISEFVRLVESLPQKGLIIDVRGNGGGHIWASEGLLQLLTPTDISPEPMQFINTALNLRICKRHQASLLGEIDLGAWIPSILQSVETGATYSSAFPITPVDFANQIGQKYYGPVVLITDARCYSATDIFAAGFQDHEIGHILGVDANTGAGGANVWRHSFLKELLETPQPSDPETPYKSLPKGADMRVAIRRSLRVGKQSGTPIEDLGIKPDSRHHMTRDDLLDGNIDLINKAGEILSSMPIHQLNVKFRNNQGTATIHVETIGLTRLDIYIDGRPIHSIDVIDGIQSLTISIPHSATLLEFAGFEDNEYVAAKMIDL